MKFNYQKRPICIKNICHDFSLEVPNKKIRFSKVGV